VAKYIVNHGGRLHIVNDDEFLQHLQLASRLPTKEQPTGSFAREATPEEVAAWYAAQGLVYTDAPAAVPAAVTENALVASEPAARPVVANRRPTAGEA
jgi:hypothetical protein